MTLTPIRVYSSDKIDDLNKLLWADISIHGNNILFGSAAEPKAAIEKFAIVQLYGKALSDLYEGKLPKGWLFGQESNKCYIEMLKDPDRGEQPYTYGQRLHKYPDHPYGEHTFNQIDATTGHLKHSIDSHIQTNRIVGIVWHPYDITREDPPCFNWFQLRLSEKNKVSLRILFRSHDYGNACFANWGAIIRCFIDEVITPAGGILEELICVSTSAHLYNSDMDMVEAVTGKIPDRVKRMLRKEVRT